MTAIVPRVIRATKAPAYLGMNRDLFDKTIRPHVREFTIGKQGVGFDRHELDEAMDAYIAAHTIDKAQPAAEDQPRSERRHAQGVKTSWREKVSPASRKKAESGTSTKLSADNDFTKALVLVRGKRPNATSSTA